MRLAVAEYLKSAQAKIVQEQWQEAKVNLQKAIEIEPHRWDIHFNLGVIYTKQQQYEQAADKFKQAIKLNPDFDWSYNNLGEIFLKLGKTGDAVQSLIRAVTLNQNHPLFYYNLGKALSQKDSTERAVACFRQAVDLKPTEAELQYKLGQAFRDHGLVAESIRCFCKVIELNSNYTLAYIALRYTRLDSRQRANLINFYQQVLLDSPHQPEALANLAELLAESDNLRDAITFSRQAVQAKTIRDNPHLAQAEWKFKQKAPDFVIIGAAKAGTTSLYSYLGKHPQVLLPNKKELRFFDRNFERGYQWYLAQFPGICDRSDLLTGEASPSYLYENQTAQKLYDFAPEAKIIVMLRNPVERTISGYYQNRKLGINQLTLSATIEREIANIEGRSEAQLASNGGVLGQSLYYYKLQRWLKIFPKNQFLIIKSENLFTSPRKSMAETFEFLNLPTLTNHRYSRHNTGFYPEVSREIKQRLSSFFAPHNQKLAQFLNTDFNW